VTRFPAEAMQESSFFGSLRMLADASGLELGEVTFDWEVAPAPNAVEHLSCEWSPVKLGQSG
jgi:hypothetical protein